MDNLGFLIAMNIVSIAGILAKIIFDYMKGDDRSNRQSVKELTEALHHAKLEIARLQERLEALTRIMETFSSMYSRMHMMDARLTRMEMTKDFENCRWDEEKEL